MNKIDILDSAPIVTRCLTNLAGCINQLDQTPETVAQARAKIGWTIANVQILLFQDSLGPPLQDCFDQVFALGPTYGQIEIVRVYIDAETPKTLGGVLVQNSCIALCMAIEAQIIAGMSFVSRQDVDTVLTAIQAPYAKVIEYAADVMDQMTFQALIGLQAAVTNHLITTERPLPRLIPYQFFQVLPSLVLAYRLYADASRADELIAENKIVHPAFCPPVGMALSA
jgi:hypothetical protein